MHATLLRLSTRVNGPSKSDVQRIVVGVHTELMSVAHTSDIGIEGCLRRMRECLAAYDNTSQGLHNEV